MYFFKSAAEKEADQLATFSEFLQSRKACQILFERFAGFLHSAGAPQMLLKVLVDKIRRMEPSGSTVDRRFRPFGSESSV
jgi:hypothetical protein